MNQLRFSSRTAVVHRERAFLRFTLSPTFRLTLEVMIMRAALMRAALIGLLTNGCIWMCLHTNVLFCQEGFAAIQAGQVLRDHRCVKREAGSRIVNVGNCIGSMPAPTPASTPETTLAHTAGNEDENQGINCIGNCVKGLNLTDFYECEPYRGASCQVSVGYVRVYITHRAECIPFRNSSCICGTYVELDEPYEEEVPYITCSGGG